jgi:hypothetical protein
MTWQSLVDGIRARLNDPSKIRWNDADILDRINSTRNELYGSHPEAFYVSSVVTSIPEDPGEPSLQSSIDFLPVWAEAVKAHVCWQCYMEDYDERQNVKLAEDYYAVWAKTVGV